jgi:hypothetical protein
MNEDNIESIVAVIEVIDKAIEYITILGKNTQQDDPDTKPNEGTKTIDLFILVLLNLQRSLISTTFNAINIAKIIPINVEKGITSPSYGPMKNQIAGLFDTHSKKYGNGGGIE